MQRACPHRRSTGSRSAPPRHQEWPDRAAGNAHPQHHRNRDQTRLGAEHRARQAPDLLAGHVRGIEDVNSLAQWTNGQFDASLSWKDVEWIASLWPGKLILKGILDVEDARIAAKTGAAALVVSNHGGRQLDGAPSSISALPAVAEAVGSSLEILFDSGIRSGQDVMRAIALGARACLSGRAYVYGLGAGGQAGVARAIEIIRNELDTSMALTGVNRVEEIDRRVIADT